MHLSATVTNNAYVVADAANRILSLQGALSSATTTQDGFWIAENGGILSLALPVSGSGKWELVDDESSEIRILAECDTLTGAVQITKGTLKVSEDFETSGNVEIKSVGGSQPKVQIADGKKARFGN